MDATRANRAGSRARRQAGRRGSGRSTFFHSRAPCAQRLCQLWHGGSQPRRLAEGRWHSRRARRARARDEKTSSTPRGPRVPLGGPHKDHRVPTALPNTLRRAFHQLAPGPPPPTRSGARSANWPRHQFHLDQESVHEQCLPSSHVRPLCLSPWCPLGGAPPSLVSPNARASAGGVPPDFPTTMGRAAASRGGEPLARSVRRGTSDGGATGARPREPRESSWASRVEEQQRRERGPLPTVNYAAYQVIAAGTVRPAC